MRKKARWLQGTLGRGMAVILSAALMLQLLLSQLSYGRELVQAARENLLREARLMELVCRSFFTPAGGPQGTAADRFAKSLSVGEGTRLTLIAADGAVIGDSSLNPRGLDNHGERPEVREALQGRASTAVRHSSSLQQEMIYAAVPLRQEGRVVGVVRLSLPLATIRVRQGRRGLEMGLLAGGLLLAAFLAALGFLRRLLRPLAILHREAEAFLAGKTPSFAVSPFAETGRCAEAMNRMAALLEERRLAIDRHRFLEEAVLAGMEEGVLAVDARRTVLLINATASRLLRIDAGAETRGRRLEEVVRQAGLVELADSILRGGAPFDKDMPFYGEEERVLQVHATGLEDIAGGPPGALLVLTDVTRMRRLERMRTEFAANVSHELKTPLTSIKGFAEALKAEELAPRRAGRFLAIIAGQADRLIAIVEDLMSLARLEHETERGTVVLKKAELEPVLRAARSACRPAARRKEITVSLEIEKGLGADLNARLFTQAVINLLDNAIKYSEPGKTVRIKAGRVGEQVAVSVSDQGPGIAPEHQSRLFERFYRIDKARSRALGGTGLGLAIVKHISLAHQGRVEVESVEGRGSTFTIYLPLTVRALSVEDSATEAP